MENEIFLFKGTEFVKEKIKRITPILANKYFEILIEDENNKLFFFDYDNEIDFEMDWNYLIHKLFNSKIMIGIRRKRYGNRNKK